MQNLNYINKNNISSIECIYETLNRDFWWREETIEKHWYWWKPIIRPRGWYTQYLSFNGMEDMEADISDSKELRVDFNLKTVFNKAKIIFNLINKEKYAVYFDSDMEMVKWINNFLLDNDLDKTLIKI